MGIRAVIRDILSMYLSYEIIKGTIFKNFTITTPILISAVILLIFAIWFFLERIGILPKLT